MFDYTKNNCPSRLTQFSHIITKSKVYYIQDNLDNCTSQAVSQILQVNFLFTCHRQFGTNGQAIYQKIQPVINSENM